MDKLITMADNVQEDIDANLFSEFMKKVTAWDYVSITRESYLALSHDEKEKLITRHYSDMKSRSSGKFYFILFIYLFFDERQCKKLCLIDVLCRENL